MLGGRVEIMKVNDDKDNELKRRTFKIEYAGNIPSVGYKREQIMNISDQYTRKQKLIEFNKRHGKS